MAQARMDEIAHALPAPSQDWSFDAINVVDPDRFHAARENTTTGETEAEDSGRSASSNSSNYTTPSMTPSAIHNENIDTIHNEDIGGQERLGSVNMQEHMERTDTGRLDEDVIMTDADVPVGDEWDPTPEELLAIAFADEDELEDARDNHHEANQPPLDNDGGHIQELGEDAGNEDREGRDDETQRQEENAGDNGENLENDANPQLANPWGMSDAQLEQLRVDQDRLFGYVRDYDSAPKPFSCVCGEASMDPSGFVNLTCPDNCVRCVECLNANVRVGLESKKNYPPRCCIPIDFENVFYHLEPVLIDRWLDVRPEFEDVAPVYCSVKECSLYLPRDLFIDNGKWALCNKCEVKTCTVCLCPQSQHESSDSCPERLDKMDKDLIKDQGWKACPQCREMIERTEGCDHMICECGAEFCYGCGRSYTPPMPCNCHGQNRWAEELREEADPQQQQQILERIANGDDERDDEEDEDEDGEEDEEGESDEDEEGEGNAEVGEDE